MTRQFLLHTKPAANAQIKLNLLQCDQRHALRHCVLVLADMLRQNTMALLRRQEKRSAAQLDSWFSKTVKCFSRLTRFIIDNSHKNTNATKLKPNMPQIRTLCNMMSFTPYQTVVFITTHYYWCTQVACNIEGHDCGLVLCTLRPSFTTTLDYRKREWVFRVHHNSLQITTYVCQLHVA